MRVARRFVVVLIAIAISGMLLRDQLGQTLLGRGDAALALGDPFSAIRYYQRGLTFDAGSPSIRDRIAFASLLLGTPTALRRCIRVTSRINDAHEATPALLLDRALCEKRLGRLRAASADLLALGERTHDARALTFAALLARRFSSRRVVISELRQAVRFDPRDSFARARLEAFRR